MIYVAILVLIIGGGAYFLWKPAPLIGAALSVALAISASIATIAAGHVGIVVLFGAVQPATLGEGMAIVNPMARVVEMSARTQTFTISEQYKGQPLVALSSDGMRIPMDFTVVYRLNANDAQWVYRNVGAEYQPALIAAPASTAAREATAHFTAQEAYSSKREELAAAMLDALRSHSRNVMKGRAFTGEGVIIEQVLLRNVDLPDRVKTAIEEKLSAEQESQRMAFVLAKERQEAERKEIEAHGIQRFQEIVRQGVDEQLLRWRGIEATMELAKSQNSKIIVIGGADGLPLILNTRE